LLSVRAFAAERQGNVVLMEAVGNPVDVEALRTSLEDWLRSMKLELHLVGVLPPPDATASFARVRVVWSDDNCVVEIFGPTGVLRRRKVLPRGGPPLLVSESAALVAQAGVQELSVEETRRPPPPAPIVEKPPEIVQQPEPAEPPPLSFAVAAYFQGRGYGAMAPLVFGGGAEATATFGDGPWHPQLSLLTSYQGPIVQNATLLDLQLQMQSVSLRLLPGVRRKLGRFEVDLALGGGLDVLIEHAASSEVQSPNLRPDGVDVAPFFTAAAGLRFRVTEASAVFLRAAVDLDPARRRYRVAIADQREFLLVPWQARPAVQFGFSFELVSRPERSP
jgi:hypothetical protein